MGAEHQHVVKAARVHVLRIAKAIPPVRVAEAVAMVVAIAAPIAAPIVATQPLLQAAALARQGVPRYAPAVVLHHARGVRLHVLELVRAHAPEVAISVVWEHARITVNTAVRIAVNSFDTSMHNI